MQISLVLKHLHGACVAAICLKWLSATKVSKYGKSEYSQALNTSYTFQHLMSFWSYSIKIPWGGRDGGEGSTEGKFG